MNRILSLSASNAARRLPSVFVGARRGLSSEAHPADGKYVGTYHSYAEFARTISMNEVARPTMKYSEGYAHYNAIYNKVLIAAIAAAVVASGLMLSLGFFHVPQHRPMKNTEEGLKFLDYPHEGYHP